MTREITTLLQGTDFVGPEDITVSGFTNDSRQVRDGFAFVAVPGYDVDGHDFIPEAIEKGAAAIVLEDMTDTQGVPTYQVPSARRALSRIAASWFDFPSDKMEMIGVTGTNGKTTVVSLLRSIFSAAGQKPASIGTLGYMIGEDFYPADLTTPDAPELHAKFADMEASGVDTVIMEVSSHALALERTADITFTTGVFTNLGRDHYDFHKTKESYRTAKGILFESLPETGHALLNYDSSEYSWFKEISNAPVLSFSLEDGNADYFYEEFASDFNGSRGTIRTPGDSLEINTGLIGRYNLLNIIAACATADLHGIAPKAITEGIESVNRISGRLELVKTSADFPQIYVDYAHTPDALESAINELVYLRNQQEYFQNIIVVFGCGGNRDKEKRPEMGAIAEKLADTVIITSDNPRNENPLAIIGEIQNGMRTEHPIIEPDRERAIYKAIEFAAPNDLILIAGKGHEDYQIISGVKTDFDDKVVVQQAMQELKSR
ncbi:MAG: UDP-N-acetylmuramoyl-L-alanyl-D-glutamate--2,6-diaminopimelate ligase [Candidatus Marinimicrobia bacterium]|nr:UDP-N-acetylmuramoyl-L-alanyl-D-glutamate--2,6-diaminopimelate ligase [Candidatus Neomarinimicrobiota bacterium]MCF7829620.1 UDP-N-acetylmuramoyl-L-alanyl-D-glutamate--2,6-diaminopimelate ligase [Candidatus Neomarinimicrobiota bacterium]MCF7879780.1 UDP-N-acetylmuramoyl-L-alanyl-D-glutamate--2,6-diaminopimelate ligase [Candidatus Neomarinimicrobiota bacterium]